MGIAGYTFTARCDSASALDRLSQSDTGYGRPLITISGWPGASRGCTTTYTWVRTRADLYYTYYNRCSPACYASRFEISTIYRHELERGRSPFISTPRSWLIRWTVMGLRFRVYLTRILCFEIYPNTFPSRFFLLFPSSIFFWLERSLRTEVLRDSSRFDLEYCRKDPSKDEVK